MTEIDPSFSDWTEDARRDALRWGGVIGPPAFIAAWVAGAAITDEAYSSIDDPISELAAVGADTQWLMTAGLIAFAVAIGAFALWLRTALPGRAWIAAAINAVATLAVAALPLDWSDTIDVLHGAAAILGYISLIAIPILAFRPLMKGGQVRLATAGMLAADVSFVCLALSLVLEPVGLFQRAGLSVTDVWLAVLAVAFVSPAPDRDGHSPRYRPSGAAIDHGRNPRDELR